MAVSDHAFLSVLMADNSVSRIELDEENSIDAAVTTYLATKKDEMLHLSMYSGLTLRVLASQITSWIVNTPDGRARDREIQRDLDSENEQPWEAHG
jgi:hypothetical protein